MKNVIRHMALVLSLLAAPSPLAAQDMLARHAPVGMKLKPIDAPSVRHLLPRTDEREQSIAESLEKRIASIMTEAFRHLGTRYRSGGKGPKAFDCSGFTSYVFARMGHAIGHSSREQYSRNTPINVSDMRRGDLVFFTSPGSGRNVGHVGIVVDVDPTTKKFTFIHASTSGGVKVNSSTDGFYARRFVGIRRVF